MNKTSAENEKRYVDSGGTTCPYCGVNGELDVLSPISPDEIGASQKIRCLECGAEWRDVYKLVGIYIKTESE